MISLRFAKVDRFWRSINNIAGKSSYAVKGWKRTEEEGLSCYFF